MRTFLAGFAGFGFLMVGLAAPAMARPLPVPPVAQPLAVQHTDWDNGCGPRCWEHRREVREREREHQRWEAHRRWERYQRSDEGRYPGVYGYQHRYGG